MGGGSKIAYPLHQDSRAAYPYHRILYTEDFLLKKINIPIIESFSTKLTIASDSGYTDIIYESDIKANYSISFSPYEPIYNNVYEVSTSSGGTFDYTNFSDEYYTSRWKMDTTVVGQNYIYNLVANKYYYYKYNDIKIKTGNFSGKILGGFNSSRITIQEYNTNSSEIIISNTNSNNSEEYFIIEPNNEYIISGSNSDSTIYPPNSYRTYYFLPTLKLKIVDYILYI